MERLRPPPVEAWTRRLARAQTTWRDTHPLASAGCAADAQQLPRPAPNHAELNQAITRRRPGILLNVDGVRGYASTRAMVEILQSAPERRRAYLILRGAHAAHRAAALVERRGPRRAEDLLAASARPAPSDEKPPGPCPALDAGRGSGLAAREPPPNERHLAGAGPLRSTFSAASASSLCPMA